MINQDKYDIFTQMCGDNYRICYTNENTGYEEWIYGVVKNASSSQIIIWSEKLEALYIIPHRSIKWMLPNGLTKKKREEISNGKIDEINKKLKDISEDVDFVANLTNVDRESVTSRLTQM